jgi:Gluconate 2-dehydrogenase subunit 3
MSLFRIARRRCLAWGSCAVTTHLLNAHEAALVAAIAEQVIPLDDEAGAAQTRAVHYVDQQLDKALARLRPAYHQGLSAFDAASLAETGASFLDLSPEQRQVFLLRVESGHKLTAFYQIVRAHAEQSLRWQNDAVLPLQFQQPLIQSEHAI